MSRNLDNWITFPYAPITQAPHTKIPNQRGKVFYEHEMPLKSKMTFNLCSQHKIKNELKNKKKKQKKKCELHSCMHFLYTITLL